jgi:putative transposase
MDNGPELTSGAMLKWSIDNRVTLRYKEPGKPIQNAFVESFNSRFGDECLNENWFVKLEEAKCTIEQWRGHYNTERPHSSLGYLTPYVYAKTMETLKEAV